MGAEAFSVRVEVQLSKNGMRRVSEVAIDQLLVPEPFREGLTGDVECDLRVRLYCYVYCRVPSIRLERISCSPS